MAILKKKQAVSLDEKAKQLAAEPDEDSKIARMMRAMPKWRYWTIAILAIAMTIFQLWIKLVKPLQPWAQIPLHMCFSLVIVFLFNPMVDKCKMTKGKKYHKLWWIYDIALIGMSCFICWYFLSHASWLNMRILTVDKMRPLDITASWKRFAAWFPSRCSSSSASSWRMPTSASTSPASSSSPA